jgi:hypothetical protein
MAGPVNLATPSRNLTGSSLPDKTPRIFWLQSITLLWMLVECGVSVYGAVSAHRSALSAFGADSFMELLSATAVSLAIVPSFPLTTDRASRLTGILLFVL